MNEYPKVIATSEGSVEEIEQLLPETKEEIDEARKAAEAKKAAFEVRLAERIERTRKRAVNAAKRLLAARPAGTPRPKTEEELVAMVEHMAKTPRRYNVYLTKPELRALADYHALWRAQQAVKAEELARTAPKEEEV